MDFGAHSADPDYAMYFPTNNKTYLKFTAYSEAEDVTAYIYNQDKEVIDRFSIEKGELKEKTLNIVGATKVGFAGKCQSGSTGILKILEPQLFNK